jgi:hypothetical protein
LIGYYDGEDESAVDYARAVFKHKGGVVHPRQSDIPPQPPIPKSSGRVKEGTSKYKGVSYNKQSNKWHATITVKGKQRHIGYYDDEEELLLIMHVLYSSIQPIELKAKQQIVVVGR